MTNTNYGDSLPPRQFVAVVNLDQTFMERRNRGLSLSTLTQVHCPILARLEMQRDRSVMLLAVPQFCLSHLLIEFVLEQGRKLDSTLGVWRFGATPWRKTGPSSAPGRSTLLAEQ